MGHTAAWCNALYLALSEAVGATRPPVSPRCRRLVSLHTESAAILYSSCRRLVVSMVNEAGCHTRGSRPINLQPSLPRHHPPNHSTSPTHTHTFFTIMHWPGVSPSAVTRGPPVTSPTIFLRQEARVGSGHEFGCRHRNASVEPNTIKH